MLTILERRDLIVGEIINKGQNSLQSKEQINLKISYNAGANENCYNLSGD